MHWFNTVHGIACTISVCSILVIWFVTTIQIGCFSILFPLQVAGVITEEIYQAVVKAGRLPPQYESVSGVGIPSNLWNLIGVCLQFKAARSPSFSTIFATFLPHLQEIPRSPTASPEK